MLGSVTVWAFRARRHRGHRLIVTCSECPVRGSRLATRPRVRKAGRAGLTPLPMTRRRRRKRDEGLALNHHLSANRAVGAEQNTTPLWHEFFDRNGRTHGVTGPDRRPEPQTL